MTKDHRKNGTMESRVSYLKGVPVAFFKRRVHLL